MLADALAKAAGREAQKALIRKNYPQHTTGVAREAFLAGALWQRRYSARKRRRDSASGGES
jgi:hypothetical protein